MGGLFGDGGLKLPDPHERIEAFMRRDLEERVKRWVPPEGSTGYLYRGSADLLLRHGRFYPGRTPPAQYEHLRGEQGQCFFGAMEAALADPTLRYVEGVYAPGYGFCAGHAWCVDGGGVVELVHAASWEEGWRSAGTNLTYLPVEHWGYWGVVFHPELVMHHLETDGLHVPMLDRNPSEIQHNRTGLDLTSGHDYPILKLPYDPDRRTLP